MVAEATINKHATLLMTQFLDLYQARYNRAPVEFNRFRDKWVFRNMFEDLGKDRSAQVIEFYLNTNKPHHSVKYLGNNYDRLNRILLDFEKDREDRLLLRKETEKRVREWEEKHGDK